MIKPRSVEWRVIPGFESHEVSSRGDVRRCVNSKTRRAGYVPRKHIDRDGYERIVIAKSPRAVHHLVLFAFSGPKPSADSVCRHLDGNKRNNSVGNLVWGTVAENAADAIRHGVVFGRKGSKSHMAKIDERDVVKIRKRRAAGEKLTDIAKDFGVHFATISYVCAHGWHHVA